MQQADEQIAASLKQSLESTSDGLTKFLASLRHAGLPDAVKGYRQLQIVLMQQRLWAQNHHRQELESLFQSIARNAEELHSVFAAFAGIMEPLIDLPNITDVPTAATLAPISSAEETNNTSLTASEESAKPAKKSAKAKPIELPRGQRFQSILGLLMMHGSLSLNKLAQLSKKSPEKLQKDITRLIEAGAVCCTEGRSPRYCLSKKYIRQLLLSPPSV